MDTILQWLKDFANWLLDLLLWIPDKLWTGFLDMLATLIEWIPVPGFFSDAGPQLAAIPSSVAYFAGLLHFGYGLGVIMTAYLLRFVIRRLPVVG